jgi:hypothetical protein
LLKLAIFLHNTGAVFVSTPIMFLLSSTPSKMTPPLRFRKAQMVSKSDSGSFCVDFLNSTEMLLPCAVFV